MRLFHLLASHDPARPTGVNRFSGYFKRAFPEVLNVTPGTVGAIEWRDGDVVVTDNHLSLLVPDSVRTIVVHHGCAATHYERDFAWRNAETLAMVNAQREMLSRPNRFFVAPSEWVADEFGKIAGWTRDAKRRVDRKGYEPTIIPHFVEFIGIAGPGQLPGVKPVIIGDWRTLNKGSGVIDKYREECPQYEFRQLDFDPTNDAARQEFYRSADAYLCLSLSEGAPYSVADAEAASLPIVSTICGNVCEFPQDDFYIIQNRFSSEHGVEEGVNAIRAALENGRRTPSFYESWDFTKWQAAWRRVIHGK